MDQDSTKVGTTSDQPLVDKPMRDGLIVEIVGGVVGGIILLSILFFWRKILDYLIRQTRWFNSLRKIKVKYTFDDLKKKVRIIVIDDDNVFPVEGFREFGYSIDSWSKIDHGKLKQLLNGEFDIIILDIYGVAKDLAERDGLDILLEIKSKNPAQVIVAYSGQSFDFSKNKFWELADEKLGKPTPFVGTQRLIDNLIEKAFNIDYHWQKIVEILNQNKCGHQCRRVESLFVMAVKRSENPNWSGVLRFLGLSHDETSKIAAVLSKLIRYVQFDN